MLWKQFELTSLLLMVRQPVVVFNAALEYVTLLELGLLEGREPLHSELHVVV